MTWFTLTLIYLVFMLIATVVNKKSLNNVAIDEIVFGGTVQLSTALFSLILVLIFSHWQFQFSPDALLLLAGLAVTYFIAVSLYYSGLKGVDLSIVSVLESTGAITSLFLGIILLNESLQLTKIAGLVLIVLASVILYARNKKLSLNKAAAMVIVSASFYALGAVFDSRLTEFGNPLSYIVVSFAIAGVSVLGVFYKRTLQAISGSYRQFPFWKGIVTNGILYSFAFWALFEAYNRGGEVSRMFPITTTSTVLVPIAGIILLNERTNVKRKIIASVVVLVGMYLIQL